MSSTDTVTFSNNTGPVTVTSNNTSIATAAVSGNNINITGVGVGSTTITVNVAANGDYGATSRTISVNVEQEQTPQTEDEIEQERVTTLLSDFKYVPDEITLNRGATGYIVLEGWAFDGNVTYDFTFDENGTSKGVPSYIRFSSDFTENEQRYKIIAQDKVGTVTINDIGYRVDTGAEIRRARCTVHVV